MFAYEVEVPDTAPELKLNLKVCFIRWRNAHLRVVDEPPPTLDGGT